MENIKIINFNYDKEQINTLDKILKLSPKVIKKKLGWDDPYYQRMIRFFTKQKKNGYKVNDNYKDKDNSRCFGKSTTLQNVDNKVLSILFSNNTYDIDMKNASFKIIKHIIDRDLKFDKDKYPLILDYADNRETFYTPLCDKQFFISSIYCANPLFKIHVANPKKVNDLLKELANFQVVCNSNLHLWNLDFKEEHHKGQNLCKIVCYYENKILQEIAGKFKEHIKFLKFDGFGISKNCDLESVINEANICSNKYGIDMINKDFPEPILLEEPPIYAEKEDLFKEEYELMKTDFELNHFIIKNPLTFYEIFQGKEIAYNKADFRDIVAPFSINNQPFFDRWLKDDNRREFQSFVWKPVIEDISNSIDYNPFKGFSVEMELLEEDEIDLSIVEEFNEKLILLLCGGEIPAQQYVIKYIAHMIQFPNKLPQSALLFKGQQGVGKDLLIDILQNILGIDMVHRDGKMENIAGTFNKSLKNKLIVQLNEVTGKDGHFNKELLKDLITVDRLNIREMRTDVEVVKNYLRLILFTNNMNAIDIPFDDRRYSVFKTGDKQERTYYDKLHDIKNDRNSLKSIYMYFKNYDLGNFFPDDPKDKVKTLAYQQAQNSNRNPFFQFLRDFLEDEREEFIYVKKKNLHYIKMKTIENYYNSWLYTMDYDNISYPKTNKGILTELGALETRASIGNKPTTRYFTINVKEMILKLDKEHSFVKPEIINN